MTVKKLGHSMLQPEGPRMPEHSAMSMACWSHRSACGLQDIDCLPDLPDKDMHLHLSAMLRGDVPQLHAALQTSSDQKIFAGLFAASSSQAFPALSAGELLLQSQVV